MERRGRCLLLCRLRWPVGCSDKNSVRVRGRVCLALLWFLQVFSCGRAVARVQVGVTLCPGVLVLRHGLGDGPARPLFSARTTRLTRKPRIVSASRRWGTAFTLRLPTEVCPFGPRLGSTDGHAEGEEAGLLNRQSVARLSYDALDVFRKCLDDALPFGEAEGRGRGQG